MAQRRWGRLCAWPGHCLRGRHCVRGSLRAQGRLCSALAGALLALSAVTGCRETTSGSDGAGPEVKAEGARLSRAIDQLREADNARKHEFLERLEAERCAALCELKEICVAAYREHVSALAAIADARALGGSALGAERTAPKGGAGPVDESRLAERLGEAQRRLEAARELSGRCVTTQGELKVRLKL